jgi:hypothetical protein
LQQSKRKKERENYKEKTEERLFDSIQSEAYGAASRAFNATAGVKRFKSDYITAFAPAYVIRILVEEGYSIDIENLYELKKRGLILKNPEDALKYYKSSFRV